MKILHLFPYLPTPANFGGAIRMFHILKHLHQNYEVTVAGYRERGDLEQFHKEFSGLRGRSHLIKRPIVNYHRLLQLYSLFTPHSYWYNWAQSKRLEEQLNRLLARIDFDVVLSEFATMGHFDLETDAIRVLDAHNVEYDNFHRMSQLEWSPIRKRFYRREFERCYQEEVEIFRKQDAIFATSNRDRNLIKKDAPDVDGYVIPNGVDTDFFRTTGIDPEPFTLVFTGAMRYVPNFDGIIHFLQTTFPLIKKAVPETKIYVVGSNPPPILKKFESESVIITGFVDDVRPYIERASVYVVPLRMGSGTRLKVVEALSMQKPIVSTAIGSEGIDVENNEHLLIRDEPGEFADAVIELMNERALRNRLIYNGYDLVKKKYDWNVIGDSIDSALHSLVMQPQLI